MFLSRVEKCNNELFSIELHAKHKLKKTTPKELSSSFFEKLKNIFKSIGSCFFYCFRSSKAPKSLVDKKVIHHKKTRRSRSRYSSSDSSFKAKKPELDPKKPELDPKLDLEPELNLGPKCEKSDYEFKEEIIAVEVSAAIQTKIASFKNQTSRIMQSTHGGPDSFLLSLMQRFGREIFPDHKNYNYYNNETLQSLNSRRQMLDGVCCHFFGKHGKELEKVSVNRWMSSCLEWLCEYGCILTIRNLISADFYNQALAEGNNAYTYYNPLTKMISRGPELCGKIKMQIAYMLLSKYPDLINRRCSSNNKTPLETALDGGPATFDGSANHPKKPGYYVSVQFVRFLIGFGADVSNLSGERKTVLSQLSLFF